MRDVEHIVSSFSVNSQAPPTPTTDRSSATAQMAELPQWVCWKYIERAGKTTKCPVNPKHGWNASASDPKTWGTFAEAQAALKRSDTLAGVGFVFTADDPFCGIDLDDCLDEHGNLLWGQEIIEVFDTNCEISATEFRRSPMPGISPSARLPTRSSWRTSAEDCGTSSRCPSTSMNYSRASSR